MSGHRPAVCAEVVLLDLPVDHYRTLAEALDRLDDRGVIGLGHWAPGGPDQPLDVPHQVPTEAPATTIGRA